MSPNLYVLKPRPSVSAPEAVLPADRQGLTLREAATILGLRPEMVSAYVRRGELKGKRIGRSWRIPAAEIEAFRASVPAWEFRFAPEE
jgi:excisionase family DNA binding protein